jgi:DNA polymerase III alpha subunit (gram-positive type)
MNYLVCDIETSGLDLINDVPVQLAYEIHNGNTDKLIKLGSFYMKPPKPLSEEVQKVHGITNEFLDSPGVLTLAQGAGIYEQLFWNYRPIMIVGYNIINFDFPMIQNWLLRHNPKAFKHPPCITIIDVMHLASLYFKTFKWPKLSVAAKDLDIPFDKEELHNASGDVRLTWEVFKKVRSII